MWKIYLIFGVLALCGILRILKFFDVSLPFGFSIGPRTPEEKAQNEKYREQSEAHQRYLDARNKYDHASAFYKGAVSRGDREDAQRWKSAMDNARRDMKTSGYKEK